MEARWAHNPKVVGSNPTPATNFLPQIPLNPGLQNMAIQLEFLKSIPYFSELSLAELEQVGKFIFEKTAERVGIAYGGEIKAPKI